VGKVVERPVPTGKLEIIGGHGPYLSEHFALQLQRAFAHPTDRRFLFLH
jgi:hypothetical protein